MPRSTDRAFEIMEIVGASNTSLKHGEIAQALKIPKSTPFPRSRFRAENERVIENVLRESSAGISRKLGRSWDSVLK